MTERKILIYPESKEELRMKSEPVESVSTSVKKIIKDLILFVTSWNCHSSTNCFLKRLSDVYLIRN